MSDLIVCAPTTMDESRTVPGSTKLWCLYCAQEVWISPAGKAFAQANPDIRIACTECSEGLMATEGADGYHVEPVPGVEVPPPMMHLARRVFQQRVNERRERT